MRGHLKKEINIRTSPCLSPLIYIGNSASDNRPSPHR
jgi:hypothetical protein